MMITMRMKDKNQEDLEDDSDDDSDDSNDQKLEVAHTPLSHLYC